MRVSEGISVSQYMLSEELNGNFLKMRVSEIRVNQIRVNQGLGVIWRLGVKIFSQVTLVLKLHH